MSTKNKKSNCDKTLKIKLTQNSNLDKLKNSNTKKPTKSNFEKVLKNLIVIKIIKTHKF